LAKLLDANQSLTASGALVKTVLHISPEVLDGQPSDERSDLDTLIENHPGSIPKLH